MKKIWLFCLCLASLSLAGCFHVPDEDWLPSRNKVSSEEVKKDIEFEQAVDSFMDWINMISSEWDDVKNGENTVNNADESGGIVATEIENINNEDMINDEEIAGSRSENQGIENVILEE